MSAPRTPRRGPYNGLTASGLREGRLVSRLERREPGILRRLLDEALVAGIEPSKTYLRKRLAEEDRR